MTSSRPSAVPSRGSRPAFGVDAVPVARAEQLLAKYGEVALRRTVTPAEREWLDDDPAMRLAVLLALKEGGIKAAGGRPRGFAWQDVHLLPAEPARGEPVVVKDLLAGFERDLALKMSGAEVGLGGALARELGDGLRATARYAVKDSTVLAVVVVWDEDREGEQQR